MRGKQKLEEKKSKINARRGKIKNRKLYRKKKGKWT
jgi:hypothetical protein